MLEELLACPTPVNVSDPRTTRTSKVALLVGFTRTSSVSFTNSVCSLITKFVSEFRFSSELILNSFATLNDCPSRIALVLFVSIVTSLTIVTSTRRS